MNVYGIYTLFYYHNSSSSLSLSLPYLHGNQSQWPSLHFIDCLPWIVQPLHWFLDGLSSIIPIRFYKEFTCFRMTFLSLKKTEPLSGYISFVCLLKTGRHCLYVFWESMLLCGSLRPAWVLYLVGDLTIFCLNTLTFLSLKFKNFTRIYDSTDYNYFYE